MSADERRSRARADLAARGWDGLIATPGVNFEYLTGIAVDRSERLTCLILPVTEAPSIVCPAFEAERLASGSAGTRAVAWEETEDPFALTADRIRSSGGSSWAVEPSTWYHDAGRLAAAAPGVRWLDGAALFEALRRPKDPDELAALGRAVQTAWAVYDEIVPSFVRGVTEREVSERILAAFAARGSEGWSLVQFGPGSAVPHGQPGDRALERGAVVLIDWGGWADGFTADLTRSFWWDGEVVEPGSAPAEFRAILDLVRGAQRAALAVMAPGVRCGEVDAAARGAIAARGYGEFFTHRLGHGLGREIHEPPYLVGRSAVPLQPGDVVTVEPGVYLPGRFGVRWEDDVLVTEEGIEILSERPLEGGER